eukprot:224439_1
MSTLLLLIFLIQENVVTWKPLAETVSCNQSVIGYYEDNNSTEPHKYKFIINDGAYDVNFDFCGSYLDIMVNVLSHDSVSLSDRYCMFGDYCGLCTESNNQWPENFTIPEMYFGVYTIHVAPYYQYDSGMYQFQIRCASSYITLETQNITIDGVVHCGDSLGRKANASSYLIENEIHYYYFNVTNHTTYMLFDSCTSFHYTKLDLLDVNFTLLFQGAEIGIPNCYGNDQLVIKTSIDIGTYIIRISVDPKEDNTYNEPHYVDWHLFIICSNPFVSRQNTTYVISTAPATWIGAEGVCERSLGTTLATILTSEDMNKAKQTLMSRYLWSGIADGVWIGLYKNLLSNSSWQWIDGTYENNIEWLNHSYPIQNDTGYILSGYLKTQFNVYSNHPLEIHTMVSVGSFSLSPELPYLCNAADG